MFANNVHIFSVKAEDLITEYSNGNSARKSLIEGRKTQSLLLHFHWFHQKLAINFLSA
jgi:hypothetical protein